MEKPTESLKQTDKLKQTAAYSSDTESLTVVMFQVCKESKNNIHKQLNIEPTKNMNVVAFFQVAIGLKYVHEKYSGIHQIVHRDFKLRSGSRSLNGKKKNRTAFLNNFHFSYRLKPVADTCSKSCFRFYNLFRITKLLGLL